MMTVPRARAMVEARRRQLMFHEPKARQVEDHRVTYVVMGRVTRKYVVKGRVTRKRM